MFTVLFIFSLFYLLNGLIKQKSETHYYGNYRFDWDEYWLDIKNGMKITEQLEKKKSGTYMKPINSFNNTKTKNCFDMKRYEHDKVMYGEAIVEMFKKNGVYNRII